MISGPFENLEGRTVREGDRWGKTGEINRGLH